MLLRIFGKKPSPVPTVRDGKLHIYWWKRDFDGKYNIGDLLSPYIVSKISPFPLEYESLDSRGKFCAVGSLINDRSLKTGGVFWGTGMLTANVRHHSAFAEFLAVRGPITRASLLSAGYSCPHVYGDPALLMPNIVPLKRTKEYRLGVIAHHSHRSLVSCADDVLFIDVLRKPGEEAEFVKEMCRCEAILSSSLHGVILAQAYGIPVCWFTVVKNPLSGADPNKKFIDYYYGAGLMEHKPLVLPEHAVIDASFAGKASEIEEPKTNLRALREAFDIYIDRYTQKMA